MADKQQVTIDGVTYQQSELTTAAKIQLSHLRTAEQQIARIKQRLAIAQTARMAYADALKAELPKETVH